MKRIIALILTLVMVMSLALTGCSKKEETKTAEVLKVGMVTDSGTIDDKSFNQGTWEGLLKYQETGKIEAKYLQPDGEAETDYLNSIGDLIDTGYNVIVTPGFKFSSAIFKAQDQFPDAKFIIIDSEPSDGTTSKVGTNTVAIYFNEHEAGFLAGVAAALSTTTGKLGFIGGMEIPPVQKFGWGFKAGVKYAVDNFGAKAEVTEYIYQGTFNDVAAGQQLASGMYDKGIDIIFQAAGGVGVGVFNEAKVRAEKGEKVFVVGVDSDQYETGKISSGSSVTLTSAMKRVDTAAYNNVEAVVNGTFPGGKVLVLSLKDNGVGLPVENPNLAETTVAKVEEAKAAILDGKVTVPSTQEEIDAFLK